MGIDLLNAQVPIRSKFRFETMCCRDMVVTKRMLELFEPRMCHNLREPQQTSSISITEEVDPESDDSS